MSRENAECSNQLESAKIVIKNLQEELEAARKQTERLREKNRELEELSITDELTGLYNQRHFHKMLEQEIVSSKKQKRSLCLLFFDVDGLKIYNDTHGHSGGNDVLKAVALGLSQSIEKNVGSGYRYGGDEFAVILPETRAGQAVEVAERINEYLWNMGFQHVTLSFGVAELGTEMDNKALFSHADDAMYVAKGCKRVEHDAAKKIHVYGSSATNYESLRESENDAGN